MAFSNIYISFCAYFLYKFCLECVFKFNGTTELDLFILSSTLFMYLFHRRVDRFNQKKNTENDYDDWNKKHSGLEHILIFLSFAVSFYLLHIFKAVSFIILLPIGAICLAYILRILPIKYNHLRSIPFAKSVIIAFVWTFSLAILPLVHLQDSVHLNSHHLSLSIIVFFYVFCQVIIFDIKDIKIDSIQGLKTFATYFGEQKTKILGWALLSLTLLVTILSGLNMHTIVSISLSIIGLSLLIWKSKSKRKPLFFYVLLESSLAFPFLFYKISQYIF